MIVTPTAFALILLLMLALMVIVTVTFMLTVVLAIVHWFLRIVHTFKFVIVPMFTITLIYALALTLAVTLTVAVALEFFCHDCAYVCIHISTRSCVHYPIKSFMTFDFHDFRF